MRITTLLIVESPTVARIIDSFQLPGLQTVPTSGFSWSPEPDFGKMLLRARVEPGLLAFRKRIRDAAKHASKIVIATDTDPSGEFIAACVAKDLKNRRISRSSLNQLSTAGIERSINDARPYIKEALHPLMNRLYLNRYLNPVSRSRSGRGLEYKNEPLSLRLSRLALIPFFRSPRSKANLQTDDNRFVPFNDHKLAHGQIINLQKHPVQSMVYRYSLPINTARFIELFADLSNADNHERISRSVVSINASNRNKRYAQQPVSYSFVQEILNSLFTRVPEGFHSGLITYPRTSATGYYEETWKSGYAWMLRHHPAEKLLPAALRNITPNHSAHEAIHPIDPCIKPRLIRPLLRKYHYDAYRLIHETYETSNLAPLRIESEIFIDGFGNQYLPIGPDDSLCHQYIYAGNSQNNKTEPVTNTHPYHQKTKRDVSTTISNAINEVEQFEKTSVSNSLPRSKNISHSSEMHYVSIKATVVSTLFELIEHLQAYAFLSPSAIGYTLDELLNEQFIVLSGNNVHPGPKLGMLQGISSSFACDVLGTLVDLANAVFNTGNPVELDPFISRMIELYSVCEHDHF